MPLLTIPSGNVASAIGGGYEVANSCRFNDGDSAQMQKDATSSDGIVDATISMWVKRGTLGTAQVLFAGNYKSSDLYFCSLSFDSSDRLSFKNSDNGTNCEFVTNRVFRDCSAWYFICVECDLSDSAADRVKIYINGTTRETSFATSTNMSGDQFFLGKSGYEVGVGALQDGSYFDGYMAEVCYIDGNAAGSPLTPSSFGEYDEDTPTVFKPIDVSGLSFGANGFYLDFEDSSNLGNDKNGGTDLTETNLAATDQSTDTCTNNFATLNFLTMPSYHTQAEGNLESFGNTSSDQGHSDSTISASSGKWYAEVKVIATNTTGGTASYPRYGIRHINNKEYGRRQNGGVGSPGRYFSNEGLYQSDGQKYINASTSSFGDTFAANDIIGIAVDCDNGAVYFSKNGTFQNSGNTSSGASKTGALVTWTPADSDGFVFACGEYNNSKSHWNFGSPPFAISSGNSDGKGYGNFEYSVPSGYYSLNTKNLAEYG